ncbi:hypothetical protein GQ53DRAFT_863916 [Thozetella sp. PMI_491]|nr:hypothetical protein GQ53DRAFT_863916 [Thozetella sp. PMI_491]
MYRLPIESLPLLGNLGNYLNDRYTRTGALGNLDEAIQMDRNVARYLCNLSNRLASRYVRSRNETDLEEGIRLARRVVDLTPDDHPRYPQHLHSLGLQLGDRYQSSGDIGNLEEAIKVLGQATEFSASDFERAGWLNNLGGQLFRRYSSKKSSTADLDRSIELARKSVALMLTNHPAGAAPAFSLGIRLLHIEEAVVSFESVLHLDNAPTLLRIKAGTMVLESSSLAISLVPRLTSHTLQNSDKQHLLETLYDLACDAAAAALQEGKSPMKALKLLEPGRGILEASLQELRADVQDLLAARPDLADPFIRLRDEIEAPATANPGFSEDPNVWDSAMDHRHAIVKRFNELFGDIRCVPGFESFQGPPTEAQIHAAASRGPVIVVNISQYRFRILELPNLSKGDIEKRASQGNPGDLRVLQWLWDVLAKPVLEALGFAQLPRDDSKSSAHIWFPLHAAGYHTKPGENVLDRVISSYSTSLKTILHSRQRQLQPSTSNDALLLAVPQAPGQYPLPFASVEIGLQPIRLTPRKENVLNRLKTCKIFHFAGHGFSSPSGPSKSSLLLEDWKDDPLTVADLLKIALQKSSPFLAYLSACTTGLVTSEKFLDENLHLINACQLAGFRHVVGTLREVNDKVCVQIARILYEMLRDCGIADDSVSWGLHQVIRHCRDSWLDGLGESLVTRLDMLSIGDYMEIGAGAGSRMTQRKASVRRSTGNQEAPLWVPYIHFGV